MKPRLKYIDAMRGFTIILVVYSHVLSYLVDHTFEPFNFYFIKFRMPLFFFISGFFVYSPNYDLGKLRQRTRNRLLQQLWPTVVLSLLYVFTLYRGTFMHFLYDDSKAGYWFTLVAVEMFLLLAPLLCLMNAACLSRKWQTAILLAIAVAIRMLNLPMSAPACRLLSLHMLMQYAPFLILGIAFRINEDTLARVITSAYVFIAAVAVFFLADNFDAEGVAGICMVYYLFKRIYDFGRVAQSRVSELLQHTGQNTLEIYLLHYFVLQITLRLAPAGFFHALRGCPGEFALCLLIAVVITALTLAIARGLRQLRVYKIIFGK